MDKEQNLQEIYMLEQNYQNLVLQKQAFQIELAEVQSAMKEMENSGDEVYKIIGQLMVKTQKEKIKEELQSKEQILKMKVKSFEKQEDLMSEKLEKMKAEVNN